MILKRGEGLGCLNKICELESAYRNKKIKDLKKTINPSNVSSKSNEDEEFRSESTKLNNKTLEARNEMNKMFQFQDYYAIRETLKQIYFKTSVIAQQSIKQSHEKNKAIVNLFFYMDKITIFNFKSEMISKFTKKWTYATQHTILLEYTQCSLKIGIWTARKLP